LVSSFYGNLEKFPPLSQLETFVLSCAPTFAAELIGIFPGPFDSSVENESQLIGYFINKKHIPRKRKWGKVKVGRKVTILRNKFESHLCRRFPFASSSCSSCISNHFPATTDALSSSPKTRYRMWLL